jgi:hypothetical protein
MGQNRRQVAHTGATRNGSGAAENLSIVAPLTGVERDSAGTGTLFHRRFSRSGPLSLTHKEIDVAHPKSDLFRHAQGELDRPTE